MTWTAIDDRGHKDEGTMMDAKQTGRMIKLLAEKVRSEGNFVVVAVIATRGEGDDGIYAVMSPDYSVKVFRALLLKTLELPHNEIEVERNDG